MLTFQLSNQVSLIQYQIIVNKAATKAQLKTLMNQTINIHKNLCKFSWQGWVILWSWWRFLCLKVQNFMRMFVSCFDKVEWFFSGSNFLYTILYRLYHGWAFVSNLWGLIIPWRWSLYVRRMWQRNPFTESIVESILFHLILKLSAYQFCYLR